MLCRFPSLGPMLTWGVQHADWALWAPGPAPLSRLGPSQLCCRHANLARHHSQMVSGNSEDGRRQAGTMCGWGTGSQQLLSICRVTPELGAGGREEGEAQEPEPPVGLPDPSVLTACSLPC